MGDVNEKYEMLLNIMVKRCLNSEISYTVSKAFDGMEIRYDLVFGDNDDSDDLWNDNTKLVFSFSFNDVPNVMISYKYGESVDIFNDIILLYKNDILKLYSESQELKFYEIMEKVKEDYDITLSDIRDEQIRKIIN